MFAHHLNNEKISHVVLAIPTAKVNISNIIVIKHKAKIRSTCMPLCACMHPEKKERIKLFHVALYPSKFFQ